MIKEIKVGGHIFKILYDYIFKEGPRDGQCDIRRYEIRIPHYEEDQEKYKETCFIHELLHAIDGIYNFNSLEERDIEQITEGIYQVMKDNYNFSFLKEHGK